MYWRDDIEPMKDAIVAAKQWSQSRNTRSKQPSILAFIDAFYLKMEQVLHHDKIHAVRDFCYAVYDPRHWGRPLPGLFAGSGLNNGSAYKARARFDFAAATEGELTVKENDLLYVLANLGNGWLTVRLHQSPRPTDPETGQESAAPVGMVPENYVQRI